MNRADKIIREFRLDKESWTHKGFHSVLHTFFLILENGFHENNYKFFRHHNRILVFFLFNNYVHWYWNDHDMAVLRKKILKIIRENPSFMSELLEEWHQRLQHFEAIFPQITEGKLKKLSNSELFNLYQEYKGRYLEEFSIAMTSGDSFSMYVDRFLEPAFQNFLKDKYNDYFLLLTSPVTRSFINLEEKSRFRLSVEIQMNKRLARIFKDYSVSKIIKCLERYPRILGLLKAHIKKYYWLRNSYASFQYLDEKFFVRELKSMLRSKIDVRRELSRLKEQIPAIKKQKSYLIRKLKPPLQLRTYIKLSEIFAYIQDRRKQSVITSCWYVHLFLKEVSRRTGMPLELIYYTIPSDLEKLLIHNKKIKTDLLLGRKKNLCCIGYYQKKHYRNHLYMGSVAKEIYQKVFEVSKSDIKELRGSVASAGKAIGRVKIIQKTHDMINMKSGDILVSSMN